MKIQIPAKILKMKSTQNELKIDFPEFQTMGMNVAKSEFEYHEDLKAPPGNICGIVATRLLWNQNKKLINFMAQIGQKIIFAPDLSQNW